MHIQIGEINFLDVKVNVYYHTLIKPNDVQICWLMRNPDSCYTGIMYMNYETGMVSYPKDVVIPIQTERDKEILPKFVIVGVSILDKNESDNIIKRIEDGYKKRNKII